jgi:CelD/BcsL family acetyltransferase involved in cellulose biosynthesis
MAAGRPHLRMRRLALAGTILAVRILLRTGKRIAEILVV